ncbi:MAG: nitronate monooxygenase [Enhydrobacter sp.]|nr:MAG: nitronate monooxygenase [Enhydrobacter sp.]
MARAEVRRLIDRMAAPIIAAPMFLVSNPALTLACCAEGVMGSFPAHGTRSREEFQAWLDQMVEGIERLEDEGRKPAPWAVNLVVHASNPRYPGDLELVEKYKVPVVLTSKGAPGDAIKRIHGWGAVALHDIANRRHAEKALEAGVDGVIAVAGGAGGHTGTINPFALMNEVRQLGGDFAIVLAGGLTTGRDVLAAETMGADLAYIGTRFIATREAMAADAHKQMILDTRATDVFLSASIDGAPANWLTPSLIAAGIDLDVLRTTLPGKVVSAHDNKKRWKDIYTAGHGVGNIADIPPASELCRRLIAQYREAKRQVA